MRFETNGFLFVAKAKWNFHEDQLLIAELSWYCLVAVKTLTVSTIRTERTLNNVARLEQFRTRSGSSDTGRRGVKYYQHSRTHCTTAQAPTGQPVSCFLITQPAVCSCYTITREKYHCASSFVYQDGALPVSSIYSFVPPNDGTKMVASK